MEGRPLWGKTFSLWGLVQISWYKHYANHLMLLAPTNQHSFQYHAHHHTVSIKEMLSSVSTRSDESSTIWSYINSYCWWFRNPANRLRLVVGLSRQGFIHPNGGSFWDFPVDLHCLSPATSQDLCDKPLGAADYLALGQAFHTIFIADIPRLTMQVPSRGWCKWQSIQHGMMKTEGYESLHGMYEATYVSNLFMICNVYDVIKTYKCSKRWSKVTSSVPVQCMSM